MAQRVQILVLITALLCLPLRGQEIPCSAILSAAIEAKAQESWWGFRNRMKNRLEKLRPEVERQLNATCPNLAACSVDVQQAVVAQAIENILHNAADRGPGLKAYAMFMGALSINTVISMSIIHSFDKVTAGVTVGLVSGITGVVVAGLGAPIYERLSSIFTGFSWRMQKSHSRGANPREGLYRRSAVGSKEDLTPLGQSGRGINRMALAAALPIFTSCAHLTELNRERGLNQSSSQVARLVIDLRKTYTEIDLTHEEFAAYAHDIFTEHYLKEGHQAFIDDVLIKILEREPNGNFAAYQRIIEYWFRPKVTLSSDTRLSQTEPPSPTEEVPSPE